MIQELFEAIKSDNLEAVKNILTAQPHLVNEKDLRGSTPLLLAAYYGFTEVSEIILQYPQHIDAQDTSGNTALMGI